MRAFISLAIIGLASAASEYDMEAAIAAAEIQQAAPVTTGDASDADTSPADSATAPADSAVPVTAAGASDADSNAAPVIDGNQSAVDGQVETTDGKYSRHNLTFVLAVPTWQTELEPVVSTATATYKAAIAQDKLFELQIK